MITEIIRFNCHILDTNQQPDDTTPEKLIEYYKTNSLPLYENTKVEIDSITWSSNKTTILTKVKRVI